LGAEAVPGRGFDNTIVKDLPAAAFSTLRYLHFNRFGMITTHVDGNGSKVYFDDLSYTVRQ
jgi:hypothetical protein